MRLRIGVTTALTAVALMAGCSGGDDGDSIATPTNSAAPVATYVESIVAVVDTTGSGCDTAKNGPGDCWLPLYEQPSYDGTPLNLGGACTKTEQATCWPQPGTKMDVNCQITTKGVTWYGTTLPATKRVTGPHLDRRTYAEAKYLRLEGQAYNLGPCAMGG